MPWLVGIDENGLGPRLGPLIVTAVLARITSSASQHLATDPKAFLHERLADSKKLVAHRHVTLGEAWARVIAETPDPASPASLVDELCLEPVGSLQSDCPRVVLPQCWSDDGECFAAGDEELGRARSDLAHLQHIGIDPVWARSCVVCVKRINDARRRGVTRLDLDLRAMESLILAARERAGTEIAARCGKVGGLTRYAGRFTLLDGYRATVVNEHRSASCYRVAGVGQVEFLRDAEELDPLVSLASLVGKWMREVLMARIVRFYRRHDDGLPDASGYHDPLTGRFVLGTEACRRALGVPSTCFVREGAKKR